MLIPHPQAGGIIYILFSNNFNILDMEIRSVNLNESNIEESRYTPLGKSLNYVGLLDVVDRYEHLIGISNVLVDDYKHQVGDRDFVNLRDNLGSRVISVEGGDVDLVVIRNDRGYSEEDIRVVRNTITPGMLGIDRGVIGVSVIDYPKSLTERIVVSVVEVEVEDDE